MPPLTWRVPRVKANETNLRMKDQIEAAIGPVLFGDWWAAQQLVTELEQRFCEEMNYRYTSAVQSGSSGLRLALLACGIKPGDEVITVANSDISTTASISQCGATPVLCDVQRSDHVLDVNFVESLITDRTRCILPVDLYGHPVDVPKLREIADRYDLFIVQDACIAIGALDYDRPIGSFADMTVFSTCAGKPFPSAGHGGLVVTNNHKLWKKVETLKGYGRSPEQNLHLPMKYDHIMEGYNLRMAPFDAAILLVKLPYLKEWSDKRRQIAGWYKEQLHSLPGVTLPSFRPESKPIYRTYTICIENRDEAYQCLSERGVQVALNYVPPVHQQTVYKQSNLPGSDNLPITEWLSKRLLALPVDPELNEQDIAYVCEQISNFVNS